MEQALAHTDFTLKYIKVQLDMNFPWVLYSFHKQ
jgi:hypothetical protein